MSRNDQITQLVENILKSNKYQHVSPDLIERIGRTELSKRRKFKDALKATKSKLHQISGAYMDTRREYANWLVELEAACGDTEKMQSTLKRVLHNHTSTRERIPILERFYTQILSKIPPVTSILDIACGLNPLSFPWMGLSYDISYYACDIYADMVAFVGQALSIIGINATVEVCDVVTTPPDYEVDLALLLKSIPCLEQIDKTAGTLLLNSIQADHLLISFPVQSISGHDKGMPGYYRSHFYELIGTRPWKVQEFFFDSELAFLVTRV
jgi:16S rRNA (guanine(1405)-N(7))-methyltransferase